MLTGIEVQILEFRVQNDEDRIAFERGLYRVCLALLSRTRGMFDWVFIGFGRLIVVIHYLLFIYS